MRKIFTFLFAALMSVGMYATTYTVTFTNLNNVAKVVENITLPHTFSCDYTNGNGELDLIIQESYNETGGRCSTSREWPWGGNDNEVVVGHDGNNHFVTINAPFVGTSFMSGYYDGSSFGNFYYSFHITIEESAPAKEWVVFGVNVPANGKPESIELVGSFIEDGWNNGIVLTVSETGWYTSFDVYANADDEFKIRAAGSWDNEIFVRTETGWTATQNIKFGDVWVDDTYKGTPCKWVELDLSGDNYGWKTAVQSIENIELTEQAQKVVVDGVIYIVRDGKMFNAQGAQVR